MSAVVLPMTTVFVDFSRIGQATRFTTRLRRELREQLRDGDHIEIYGDDVAPMPAVIVAVSDDRPDVEIQLL